MFGARPIGALPFGAAPSGPIATFASNRVSAQPVSEFEFNEREHRRKIAQSLNSLIQGKFNAIIDVTLTAYATTTTINDSRIGLRSAVIPGMALTASAATEMASGNIYVDQLAKGSCVVHHSSSVQTDRVIRFIIIG